MLLFECTAARKCTKALRLVWFAAWIHDQQYLAIPLDIWCFSRYWIFGTALAM
jgi:hypothetical protein